MNFLHASALKCPLRKILGPSLCGKSRIMQTLTQAMTEDRRWKGYTFKHHGISTLAPGQGASFATQTRCHESQGA